MATSDDFQIKTIIRFEPDLLAAHGVQVNVADRFKTMSDFYLLAFHQDKVMNAAKHFDWPTQFIERYSGDRGLQVWFAKLLLHVYEDRNRDGPLQILVTLAKDGKLDISSSPAVMPGLLFPRQLLVTKGSPTLNAFGNWYERVPIQVVVGDQTPLSSRNLRSSSAQSANFENASTFGERLIVSQYGEIIEGQFTTPYFLRNGIWVAPAFSGLVTESVTRRYALEHGLCKEGIILRSTLRQDDPCWLSDGVRGFFSGTIFLLPLTSHQNGSDSMATSQAEIGEQSTGKQIGQEHSNLHYSHRQILNTPPSTVNDNQEHAYEDENDDEDDEDDIQIIPNPHTSKSETHLPKRPETSLSLPSSSSSSSSSPSPTPPAPTRRSKRGQPFQAIYLADPDEPLHNKTYQPIRNPDQGGRMRVDRRRRRHRHRHHPAPANATNQRED
jgi:4-amino-4-deoxychorismate lyase